MIASLRPFLSPLPHHLPQVKGKKKAFEKENRTLALRVVRGKEEGKGGRPTPGPRTPQLAFLLLIVSTVRPASTGEGEKRVLGGARPFAGERREKKKSAPSQPYRAHLLLAWSTKLREERKKKQKGGGVLNRDGGGERREKKREKKSWLFAQSISFPIRLHQSGEEKRKQKNAAKPE